jgi:hypothetical protein
MPNHNEIQTVARKQTQEMLGRCPSFLSLPRSEQAALYKDLVSERRGALAEAAGLSTGMAGPKKASDLIDDNRHLNKRIDQAGELAGDFVREVDFPKFVRDLLKGVFDANLEVTLKQMEAYTNLMKAATASISKFVNSIDNTAAFGYLAENNSDEFSFDFDDEEKDENGQPKAVLTDKEGNRLDVGDNEIKAKIMDAKIAMAKEQRALLRETILMGVTRLVVEKGVVKAAVVFDVKASEKVQKQDKAAMKKAMSSGTSVTASGGLLGKIFGGPTAGYTSSHQESQISVSSAKSAASTDLAAKITGSVEIQFKSDYFKLDNFATMYGPQANGGAPAGPESPAPTPALPPQS